jgi:hypothetical protein
LARRARSSCPTTTARAGKWSEAACRQR